MEHEYDPHKDPFDHLKWQAYLKAHQAEYDRIAAAQTEEQKRCAKINAGLWALMHKMFPRKDQSTVGRSISVDRCNEVSRLLWFAEELCYQFGMHKRTSFFNDYPNGWFVEITGIGLTLGPGTSNLYKKLTQMIQGADAIELTTVPSKFVLRLYYDVYENHSVLPSTNDPEA